AHLIVVHGERPSIGAVAMHPADHSSSDAATADNTAMVTLVTRLTHSLRGLRGLTRAALDLDPVDEETLLRRRRICAACSAATRTRHLGRVDLRVLTPASLCGVCKCNLHAKTRLASETCPRHRW